LPKLWITIASSSSPEPGSLERLTALAPKCLIPIRRFERDWFPKLFDNVFLADDGQWVEVRMTDEMDALGQSIRRLKKNAEIIRSDLFSSYKDELLRHNLRIRPTGGGFSLVSYHHKTPQLGKSNLQTIDHLKQSLQSLSEVPLVDPGRPTPEKELQSYLIGGAVRSGGVLAPINKLLGGSFWFISDEIRLPINGKPLLADMLLVKEDEQGSAQLVNVELKSIRAGEVFGQADDFRPVLEGEFSKDWQRFAEVMSGRSFRWSAQAQTTSIVIWPRSRDPARAKTRELLTSHPHVDALGYERIEGAEPIYTFTRE
jgi:hypothetical protein